MPTPARTSLEQIVKAGRDIVEANGIDGLTMQSIASRVGVRAPSLYKRLQGRNELLRLVANDAAAELTRDSRAVSPARTRGGTSRASPEPSAGSPTPTPVPTR